jgi:hypothetical protein
MKKNWLLLIGAAILVFAACDTTNTDDLTFKFEETKCENPWDALPEQGNYIVEIRGFLNQQGIEVVTLEIDVYDEKAGINCNECNCLTGRNIIISVPPKDSHKAEAIGFVVVK